MDENPLRSLSGYSQFIAKLVDHPTVVSSTAMVWSASPYTGIAEGEIVFVQGYRLRLREELDFDAGLITSYGYEVYHGDERLFWYDDFPHPNDENLVVTLPHHKHEPPDIKHNRRPAPDIKFNIPNLPYLISEIEVIIGK